jgi:hypothetical protein
MRTWIGVIWGVIFSLLNLGKKSYPANIPKPTLFCNKYQCSHSTGKCLCSVQPGKRNEAVILSRKGHTLDRSRANLASK